MAITALEMISRICQGAGFTRVSKEQVLSEDSFANKAYYALLEAISFITSQTPDWCWNDGTGTVTTTAGQDYVTLGDTVNINFINWVAIDLTNSYKFLFPLWNRDKLITDIYPYQNNILEQAQPFYWYLFNSRIYLYQIPNAAYNLVYGFQKLPQIIAIDDIDSTNLNINPDIELLVKEVGAMKMLEQYGGGNKASEKWTRYCDPSNNASLFGGLVRNNRLNEKRDIRFKPAYYLQKEEHI